MEPTERQFSALDNFIEIIQKHLHEVAEAAGVSVQTLQDWTAAKGEPTREQADKILEFLRTKV
jgi:transcriptional regulator with XRE-family HTH domain